MGRGPPPAVLIPLPPWGLRQSACPYCLGPAACLRTLESSLQANGAALGLSSRPSTRAPGSSSTQSPELPSEVVLGTRVWAGPARTARGWPLGPLALPPPPTLGYQALLYVRRVLTLCPSSTAHTLGRGGGLAITLLQVSQQHPQPPAPLSLSLAAQQQDLHLKAQPA